MDAEAFDKYVEERYKGQMLYYKAASAKNQNKYKQFQWVLIVLSATTPVFAALKEIKLGTASTSPVLDLNVIVLIISSIVAILTTGLKTFSYQELWVNARATYEKLKPEIHYYSFDIGPYGAAGVNKETVFVTRVEAILSAEHDVWPPAKTSKQEMGEADTKDKEGKKDEPTE
jgi:hypothetical protein